MLCAASVGTAAAAAATAPLGAGVVAAEFCSCCPCFPINSANLPLGSMILLRLISCSRGFDPGRQFEVGPAIVATLEDSSSACAAVAASANTRSKTLVFILFSVIS